MMAYEGVEIQLHSFLTLTLNSQLQSLPDLPLRPVRTEKNVEFVPEAGLTFCIKDVCPDQEPNRDISCAHPVAKSLRGIPNCPEAICLFLTNYTINSHARDTTALQPLVFLI
jgi:hypothetical protein